MQAADQEQVESVIARKKNMVSKNKIWGMEHFSPGDFTFQGLFLLARGTIQFRLDRIFQLKVLQELGSWTFEDRSTAEVSLISRKLA